MSLDACNLCHRVHELPGPCPREPPTREEVSALNTLPLSEEDLELLEGGKPIPEGEPELLGLYRLLRVIGEGGMARVYLAQHTKLGRICAIKRLHSSHFEDHITVGRFLAEARAVSGIRHPNLVGIYDVIEQPDEVCLVMEYLDGRDLGQILRDKGPLTPDRAALLCAQACDGLAAVHARGIVHRDIKPDNLFLAKEANGRERVKLLDFGVARLREDNAARGFKTKTGQTVGTPQYMSPEQATASDLDARSDIYMMGVALFELVTGRPPFRGAGYGEVMLMHVNDAPPTPSSVRPGLPRWIEDVILRCLDKSVERRYQSARELALALRREVTAEVTLPVERMAISRGWSSRPWLLVLGGALGVAGLAGVAYLVLGHPHAETHAQTIVEQRPPPPPVMAPPPVVVPPPVEPTPSTIKLHVIAVPAGSAVRVGGELRCLAPCDVELPAEATAPVEVLASAPGFLDEKRLVDVASPPEELRLTLRRDARPPR